MMCEPLTAATCHGGHQDWNQHRQSEYLRDQKTPPGGPSQARKQGSSTDRKAGPRHRASDGSPATWEKRRGPGPRAVTRSGGRAAAGRQMEGGARRSLAQARAGAERQHRRGRRSRARSRAPLQAGRRGQGSGPGTAGLGSCQRRRPEAHASPLSASATCAMIRL